MRRLWSSAGAVVVVATVVMLAALVGAALRNPRGELTGSSRRVKRRAAQLERRKRKAREVRAMAGGDAMEDGGGVRRSDARVAGAEPSFPADDECGAGLSQSTALRKNIPISPSLRIRFLCNL